MPTQVKKMPPKPEITQEKQEAAEAEIREKQKTVDFDTKEYPIEILVYIFKDEVFLQNRDTPGYLSVSD
jgi:hypothetical protein